MAIKFSQFTTGTTTDTSSADYVVGYESTLENIAGGERKWTISTLANAVSGIMKTQLNYDVGNATNITALSGSLNSVKAWINYDGTANTVRDSYNVAGVTKTGTGRYYINFTFNFANTDFAAVGGGAQTTIGDPTLNNQLFVQNGSGSPYVYSDISYVMVIVAGRI